MWLGQDAGPFHFLFQIVGVAEADSARGAGLHEEAAPFLIRDPQRPQVLKQLPLGIAGPGHGEGQELPLVRLVVVCRSQVAQQALQSFASLGRGDDQFLNRSIGQVRHLGASSCRLI